MTFKELATTDQVVLMIAGDGTVSCVPKDPSNRDWQVCLAWLEQGNTLLPADDQ